MKFEGMYSALFSLYDENLKVNRASVEKLMAYNQKNGLAGFYVGGATGECVVLPNRTRIEMVEIAMENRKDSKIIAHIGATRFEDTLELLDHATGLGVDAVASLPPALKEYYTEDETVRYYQMLASRTDRPVMAYIQAFYRGDIVKLAGRLMEIPGVIGIKLTVPNYYLFEQLRRAYPDMNILNGPDESALAGMICGADGAIGTTYNLLPSAASGLYRSYRAGKIEDAREYQHQLNRAIDVFFGHGIVDWKTALRLIDIDPGFTVEPAILPDAEKTAQFLRLLTENGTADLMRAHP